MPSRKIKHPGRTDSKVTFKSVKDLPIMAVSLYDMSYNKTGTWRNVRPVIDLERCIYCTNCWKYCPEPAIDLVPVTVDGKEKGKPVVNYDYCKGCGICWTECPVNAISPESEDR